MKRMYYWDLSRQELAQVKKDYLHAFAGNVNNVNLKNGHVRAGLQTRWENWLNQYGAGRNLPKKIAYLLVADFGRLADVYDEFKKLHLTKTIIQGGVEVDNPAWIELTSIFKYTNGFDTKIANFFIDHAERLKIKTCYYCEMSYVNTYSYWDQGAMVTRRQFDVDHFLPKDDCPLLALSLFNFVPSCQVCNSRIKLEAIPGSGKNDYKLLAPCSKDADYERNIQIRLRPKYENGHLKGRYIHFKTAQPYNEYVRFFHLEERYEFHKVEAVRLNRLQKRYPDVKIRSIAKLLHYKPAIVKEDIFHLKYMQQEGRCFGKMTRDILR